MERKNWETFFYQPNVPTEQNHKLAAVKWWHFKIRISPLSKYDVFANKIGKENNPVKKIEN